VIDVLLYKKKNLFDLLPTSALFVARFCVEFYRKKYKKTVTNNTDFNGLSDLGFVCLRLARR
jgi:hypothetical protein